MFVCECVYVCGDDSDNNEKKGERISESEQEEIGLGDSVCMRCNTRFYRHIFFLDRERERERKITRLPMTTDE